MAETAEEGEEEEEEKDEKDGESKENGEKEANKDKNKEPVSPTVRKKPEKPMVSYFHPTLFYAFIDPPMICRIGLRHD